MRNLLTKRQKHLLWKDEAGDSFVLLKYAEIFRYSKNQLQVYCWSSKRYSQIKGKMPIFDFWQSDDGLYCFKVDNANLSDLIAFSPTQKRTRLKGKWLKDKEVRLGHQILPFRPKFKKEPRNET